jgi:ParB-like chromosome segregation protein Spo0J
MNTFPEYERHPFNVFPVMSDPEIDELAEDIKTNGLSHPIVIFAGKILDGWNRFLACKRVGVIPDFVEYSGDTPIQFSLSLNLRRRHLTTSQRSAIAADLANLQDGQRADYAAASNEAAVSQGEAAELLNVSRSGVQRAADVRTADPELHDKVKAGEMSLEDARRAIAPEGATSKCDTNTVTSWTAPESDGSGEADDVADSQSDEDEYEDEDDIADKEFLIKQFKRFIKEFSKDYAMSTTAIRSCIRTYLDGKK